MVQTNPISTSQFLAELGGVLADPAGQLRVPSLLLLSQFDAAQIDEQLDQIGEKAPSTLAAVGSIFAASLSGGSGGRHWLDVLPSAQTMSAVRTVVSHNYAVARHAGERQQMLKLLGSFVLTRDAVALNERERALMRATGSAYGSGSITADDWSEFYALLTWNEGKCILTLPKELAPHKSAAIARNLFHQLMRAMQVPHEQFLTQSMQRLAHMRHYPNDTGRAIERALNQGARWLELADVPQSAVFSNTRTPASLMIGYQDGQPLFYGGDASLITIAGPGTGKTQGQVIPNLLAYPGSAFVLDVKGELWRHTAGFRAVRYGPVYRFSPSDPSACSHAYNPFDHISTEAYRAAQQCEVLANNLVPDNPQAKDPYWDRRARDFMWTFALLVAVDTPPGERNLSTLARLMSVRTNFDGDEDRIDGSETDILIRRLEAVGHRTGIPELGNTGAALRDGLLGSRLGSIFDAGRAHLNALTRAPLTAKALARSDWSPRALRETPGTTVYLTFRPGEMRAFAGIIRLILQQHADGLTEDFDARGEAPPVTFFLDEMPQLGPIASMNDLMDVGRGAGVRLWLFAQYLGQIRSIYGARADGLVGAAQVRCFCQPDTEAAKFIEPLLGKTRNFVTGEERPLAEIYELSGRAYGDKVICVPRNELPALMDQRMAYEHLDEWMNVASPEVPSLL